MMGAPFKMQTTVFQYILKQKMRGRDRYPLVLMLEPLFRCNLACAGCGKIQHPVEILRRNLSPEECWGAAEECGAPIVSIAGGEPFLHPEIHPILQGFIKRGKFVYLCTNALLLERNLSKLKPSDHLILSVHLDGLEKTHDRMVCREGVFKTALRTIRQAKEMGFCVMTNTTIFHGEDPDEFQEFFDTLTSLKVDGMMISPGYAYEKAPQQDVFLKRDQTKAWFRTVLKGRHDRGWLFNHTPFYLDFLEGKKEYDCTPWGNPLRNIFGWQRPCYLQQEGYAKTYQQLLQETDWSRYGHRSGNPKCANCMTHCGFEPTAVNDAFSSPRKFGSMVLDIMKTKKPAPLKPSDRSPLRNPVAEEV